MRKDDLIRVRHMLEAAGEAVLFARNRTRKDLDSDRMLTLSIVKSVELIGEAATRISKEARETHPEIPWTDIVAMRNRLIHVYLILTLTESGTRLRMISRLSYLHLKKWLHPKKGEYVRRTYRRSSGISARAA